MSDPEPLSSDEYDDLDRAEGESIAEDNANGAAAGSEWAKNHATTELLRWVGGRHDHLGFGRSHATDYEVLAQIPTPHP
ncbi:MAG: hypothetical protein C0501_28100, partial [Isosphaera sp.]|nr:hypothetical protein [Isosphaera sp.]